MNPVTRVYTFHQKYVSIMWSSFLIMCMCWRGVWQDSKDVKILA